MLQVEDMIDVHESVATLAKRDARRHAQDELLCQRARENAQQIVRLVAEQYDAARVWQWGSLLDGTFTSYSDIDIAVEGIADVQAFFRLLGDAMTLSHFPLDIVQMERIEPEFAELIRQKGKVVYERA